MGWKESRRESLIFDRLGDLNLSEILHRNGVEPVSTQSPPKSHVSEILTRIVGPEEENLTPEAARGLLQLKMDKFDRLRAHELAVKNQSGTLTGDELEELDAYRRVGRLVDLLHAKARRSLRRAGLDRLIHSDE